MKLFVASVLCFSVLGISAFSFPYVYNGTLLSNIAAALSVDATTPTDETPEISERQTAPVDDLAPAAAFTPGNVVIYRVGDGVGSLGTAAAAVFLDEYTTTGTLVQSIPMPTSLVGSNRRLTASGTANSEGFLSRSVDGNYLVVPGYDAAPGTASITSSTSATVNRVIGRISPSGQVDTTTALSDAISGGNPRGAASTNGSDLWISGTSSGGGIRYATFGSTTSTSLTTTPTNFRASGIFGGQLFVSSQTGAFRLSTVGVGTPTTTGQTTTNLPGFPTGSGSPYQFLFADLTPTVSGVDTVYVADESSVINGGGAQKYSLVGGTWTLNGTIGLAITRGLTGVVSGTNVTLYATANGTTLQTATDTSGYNAAPNGAFSSLVTAGTNTAFRGIALAPVAPNTPPQVQNVTLEGAVGTAFYEQDVDDIYFDDEGDTLASITNISVSGGPGPGSAAVLAGNIVRFTPSDPALPTTFANPYVVTYRVTDSAGSFTNATMTVRVYDPPSVTTSAATAVTANSATLNGSANNVVIASPITRYFRYSNVNPGTCNDAFGTQVGGSVGVGPYSENITGLSPSTQYFFCAIATSTGGTTVGALLNFTTAGPGVFSFDPVSYSPSEADGTAAITVKRNGGTSGTVQVEYGGNVSTLTRKTPEGVLEVATGGPACVFGSGVDYVTPSGTLTFVDGDDTETFPVTICNDQLFETTEQFVVHLSNPTNGSTIANGTATVNILDNDVQPSLQFSASNYDVNENGGTATVTVTRSGAAEHQLTVNYAALVGGLTNPATPSPDATCNPFSGEDFVATSGTLTFVPNDTSESFPITICNDNLFEASSETIAIALNTQSEPALLGTPNEGTVTIIPNNDPPVVQFSVAAANAPEGTTPYVATVTRTGAIENSFSVNYTSVNGSAVAGPCGSGGDFTLTSGTLNFVAGDPGLPINVPICNDTDFEGNESFTISLSSATGGAVVGAINPQTVTIVDNDNATPVINSSAPTTATEDVQYTYNATATDPDGPGQTWSLLGTHTCGGSINPTTGVFTFTPLGPVPPTNCVVAIRVDDGGTPNLNATQTTTVNITAVNDGPVINSTAPTTATVGVQYTYNATRLDPDGPGQTWSLTASHTCGGSIVASTGVFTFTPASATPPTCVVAVQVSDGGTPNLSATQNTTVNISGSATLVVDNLSDNIALNACTTAAGDCSLRGANSIANDGDTISFDSGIFAMEGSSLTITLGGSELFVSDDITITGPGADQLTIDAAGASRVMTLADVTAVVSGLTLKGGTGVGPNFNGSGGALLTINGSISLDGVRVTGNTTAIGGGGAALFGGTDHIVRNSTFDDNHVTGGIGAACGGLELAGTGTGTITNITVSGNTATGQGGGLCLFNNSILRNSTITGNESEQEAGGLYTGGGSYNVGSTVIAGNSAPIEPEIGVASGTFTSAGFNLVGDSSGDAGDTGVLITYQSSDILNTPPQLGLLQDNGGPTFTHKPQNNWPGHDKGCAFGTTTDQRGNQRTIDWSGITNAVCSNPAENGTDIGAVELVVPTIAPATIGGRILTVGGRGITNVRVTVHSMSGELIASANSGTFGYYKLYGVTTGTSYIVTVKAKRFAFDKPSRIISLDDNVEDLDFVADP